MNLSLLSIIFLSLLSCTENNRTTYISDYKLGQTYRETLNLITKYKKYKEIRIRDKTNESTILLSEKKTDHLLKEISLFFDKEILKSQSIKIKDSHPSNNEWKDYLTKKLGKPLKVFKLTIKNEQNFNIKQIENCYRNCLFAWKDGTKVITLKLFTYEGLSIKQFNEKNSGEIIEFIKSHDYDIKKYQSMGI